MNISKKAFAQIALPNVGDIVNACKVIYVKAGSLEFTAQGSILPDEKSELVWKGKKYFVKYVNNIKSRFTAVFTGFSNFTIPNIKEDEATKVI